jgi:hypothetical protein
MRSASVADGDAARLAATVSLLLAAGKLDDHLADGDVTGALRRRSTGVIARRWAAAGSEASADVGLDAGALLIAVGEQPERERTARSLLDVTAPTETATALAFRHTAVLAGRPGNAEALAEIGRLFGRLAYVLDAVDDLHADRASGAWNPIVRFALTPGDVRAVCDDAVLGIRLALRDVALTDARLVHALLVHETEEAVRRAFPRSSAPLPPLTPPLPPDQQPPDGTPIPDAPEEPPTGWEAPPSLDRGRLRACLGWAVACGTCQVCCAEEYQDPRTGQPRQGWCRGCDCDCGCPDCGDCCDCADCCCDGCDCSC